MSVSIQIAGSSSTSITLNFKTISEDMTSSKMKVGTGTGNPTYIRFGYESKIVATGQVFSSTDHNKLKAFNGDVLLEVTASSYPEIIVTAGTTPTRTNLVVVDNLKISRKGGYLDMWDYSITLLQGNEANLKRWT